MKRALIVSSLLSLLIGVVSCQSGRPANDKSTTAALKSAPNSAKLSFRMFCTDEASEPNPEQVYILVIARRSDGVWFFDRLPEDTNTDDGRWEMSEDEEDGTDSASGKSHCISDRTLATLEISPEQTWRATVFVMEMDDGTNGSLKDEMKKLLGPFPDTSPRTPGGMRGDLSSDGFFKGDHDEFLGSFDVTITNPSGTTLVATWEKRERVEHSIPDPDFPLDKNRQEFRFNGEDSNHVGWFGVR